MRINPGVIILGVAAAGAWAFSRWYTPRPEFPPLLTKADDPLMLEAMENARASLPDFVALLRAAPRHALVKLCFLSNGDQVEHLWAEVLGAPVDDKLEVRLVTPPVTHTGRLNRLRTLAFSEIEDWQVRDADGKIHGGFTHRAMYAIARRDGIELPPKLRKAEDDYR